MGTPAKNKDSSPSAVAPVSQAFILHHHVLVKCCRKRCHHLRQCGDKIHPRVHSQHSQEAENNRRLSDLRFPHWCHSVPLLLHGGRIPFQRLPLGIHLLCRIFHTGSLP